MYIYILGPISDVPDHRHRRQTKKKPSRRWTPNRRSAHFFIPVIQKLCCDGSEEVKNEPKLASSSIIILSAQPQRVPIRHSPLLRVELRLWPIKQIKRISIFGTYNFLLLRCVVCLSCLLAFKQQLPVPMRDETSTKDGWR